MDSGRGRERYSLLAETEDKLAKTGQTRACDRHVLLSHTRTDFSLSTRWDFSALRTCDGWAGDTLFSLIPPTIPPSPDLYPHGTDTGITVGPAEGLVMGVV